MVDADSRDDEPVVILRTMSRWSLRSCLRKLELSREVQA